MPALGFAYALHKALPSSEIASSQADNRVVCGNSPTAIAANSVRMTPTNSVRVTQFIGFSYSVLQPHPVVMDRSHHLKGDFAIHSSGQPIALKDVEAAPAKSFRVRLKGVFRY
ncbi:MAG: hypothetical protein DSM106950_26570 [Stigonema ocellatum SAG 48.90 = DSM 106950]|nr:hypothetical protein [Stigonema ocellatum SAG 48.90 = DSM 106950]